MEMKASRVIQAGVITLGTFALCFTLFGFVPSCEKELASLYPPALKADLSACALAKPVVKPTAVADITKFARRLNGAWELKMRTVQGITSDTRQLSSKLYFDIAPGAGNSLAGNALLIEQTKPDLVSRVSTTRNDGAQAFWDVTVAQKGKMALSFGMNQGSGSKEPAGVARGVKEAEFSELDSVFVSVDKGGAWDRIIVSDTALVYVSCQRGVIERYAKVSGQKPQVDGLPVKMYWQKREAARLSASARRPGLK
jgi:hypothetical protein